MSADLGTPTWWHEQARRIREVNEANGFDAPTWENLPVKVMLVVTELDEGLQAVEPGGDDNLLEELADAAIRLVDILEAVNYGSWAARSSVYELESCKFKPLETLLVPTLRWLCRAVEDWRKEKRTDAQICLEYALLEVRRVALGLFGEDALEELILIKTEKNAARGKLHGKARSA